MRNQVLKWITIGLLLCWIPFACGREAAENDRVTYLVTLKNREAIESPKPAKLSPALLAIKDADGLLKGADNSGRVLIEILPQNASKLQNSPAVMQTSREMPASWKAVTRLKLSYTGADKPAADELKKLGLTIVEDYEKGSFMTVDLNDAKLDARLAATLENIPRIGFITPSYQVKAIQAQ